MWLALVIMLISSILWFHWQTLVLPMCIWSKGLLSQWLPPMAPFLLLQHCTNWPLVVLQCNLMLLLLRAPFLLLWHIANCKRPLAVCQWQELSSWQIITGTQDTPLQWQMTLIASFDWNEAFMLDNLTISKDQHQTFCCPSCIFCSILHCTLCRFQGYSYHPSFLPPLNLIRPDTDLTTMPISSLVFPVIGQQQGYTPTLDYWQRQHENLWTPQDRSVHCLMSQANCQTKSATWCGNGFTGLHGILCHLYKQMAASIAPSYYFILQAPPTMTKLPRNTNAHMSFLSFPTK